MKIEQGWKVCQKVRWLGRTAYRSLLVEEKDGGVWYNTTAWTKPKADCGPLCVFESAETARAFVYIEAKNINSNFAILQCEYLPEIKIKVIWKGGDNRGLLAVFPTGTRLASAVRLLEGEKNETT